MKVRKSGDDGPSETGLGLVDRSDDWHRHMDGSSKGLSSGDCGPFTGHAN